MNAIVERFMRALLMIDRVEARQSLIECTATNSGLFCIDSIILPAFEQIGRDWEEGNVALSQVYMGARICEELVDSLVPQGTVPQNSHQMALVVLEDHHLLGKRIVSAILRSSGYAVHDFGSMGVNELVNRICAQNIAIVFVSTLMLSSALQVKNLVKELRLKNSEAKVIVGGAPFRFDESLWQEVNADAMGKTAADAPVLARKFGKG